ncbi:hypothetical protein ACFY0R_37720 [Streptomyces sp. NPDC001633]|uniref:hypothetical protein n=1 Tax=Streptomyces sp. NPDC001633 TaxID=3364595 RepID=UPI0036C60DE5
MELEAQGVTLGPVLAVPARAAVEFLTPCDHQWRLQSVARLASVGHIRWPAPDVTLTSGRQAECGRTWIVPPLVTVPTYTPLAKLHTAVKASLDYHTAAAAAATDERRAVTDAQSPRGMRALR